MAQDTTDAAQQDTVTDTPEVTEDAITPEDTPQASNHTEPVSETVSPNPATAEAIQTSVEESPPPVSAEPSTSTGESERPQEPDALQPLIDKAYETIQHEIEHDQLDQFLRGHVKTFREEWDTWPDSAKDAYLHMMTSQLVQRKAAKTRIMNYEELKLPVPSALTTLFESIQQSQVKPQKRTPVLLLPPNLRPTYSLKK